MPDAKPYGLVQVQGEIRTMPREDGKVGLNVFGTYALLTPMQARIVANQLLDAAAEVAYE